MLEKRIIFDITLGELIGRALIATGYAAATFIAFYELPNLLLSSLGGLESSSLLRSSSLPLNTLYSPSFFLYYAAALAALSAIHKIFNGNFLGDAAAVANGVAQIAYIYLVTNGGLFYFSQLIPGMSFSVDFRSLLYLMMLPSAIGIIASISGATSRNSLRAADTSFDQVSI